MSLTPNIHENELTVKQFLENYSPDKSADVRTLNVLKGIDINTVADLREYTGGFDDSANTYDKLFKIPDAGKKIASKLLSTIKNYQQAISQDVAKEEQPIVDESKLTIREFLETYSENKKVITSENKKVITRIVNALSAEGVHTVADLRGYTEGFNLELRKMTIIPNFAAGSLQILKSAVENYQTAPSQNVAKGDVNFLGRPKKYNIDHYDIVQRGDVAAINKLNEKLRKDGKRLELEGVELHNADLTDADLSGANLSGANISGSILSGANLTDANLSGSILISNDLDANLSGANLSDAVLINNYLLNAKGLDKITKINGVILNNNNTIYIKDSPEWLVAINKITKLSQFQENELVQLDFSRVEEHGHPFVAGALKDGKFVKNEKSAQYLDDKPYLRINQPKEISADVSLAGKTPVGYHSERVVSEGQEPEVGGNDRKLKPPVGESFKDSLLRKGKMAEARGHIAELTRRPDPRGDENGFGRF